MASSITGGLSTNSYESIATTTLSTATASITFSSIPATYTHLQIRGIARGGSGSAAIRIRCNADTATNYAAHELYGDGASAGAYAESGVSSGFADYFGPSSAGANIFGVGVIDILDYTNTNKKTTIRSLSGYDNNGSGGIALSSTLWNDTPAVTSITLFYASTNLVQYSSFALYGIKG